jgi:hypothetical protein
MNLNNAAMILDRAPEQATDLAAKYDPTHDRYNRVTPERLRRAAAFAEAVVVAVDPNSVRPIRRPEVTDGMKEMAARIKRTTRDAGVIDLCNVILK